MQLTLTLEPKTRETIDMFADDLYLSGVLTDEHAACSYGQPLVVIDGTVYGPIELPGRIVGVAHQHTPAADPALYQTDDEIRASRTAESIALVEAARAAGYKIECA